VDITPYTFGTGAVGMVDGLLQENVYVPMIHRGTPLPARKGEVFLTMYDGQPAVDVRIYQGESPSAEDNIFIGNFLVEGLKDAPAGNQIILTLALDLNGVLEVTAVEKRTGLSKTVRMQAGNGAAAFDLDQAREHLSAAFGPAPAAPGRFKETDETKQPVIVLAKDLRKRANALLDDIDATDAEELRGLLAESQKAVADGDLPKLTQLNESLSDMLFYLED